MADYFSKTPVYNYYMFEWQFWMSWGIFDGLCHNLQEHDCFWILESVSSFLQFFFSYGSNILDYRIAGEQLVYPPNKR